MTTDTLTTISKTGLQALLTPKDSVLLLIDHQPFQFANLHSHEPTMVVNNVIGLAKTAKLFGVPTILTTVLEERGGSGGVTSEAHEMAVRRMVQAGAVPMTWMAVQGELQRDWARESTAQGLAEILAHHGGGSGVAFAWEMQLLAGTTGGASA